MKDELVTFETAKLAKEKGFDLVTNKYWVNYYTGQPIDKWRLFRHTDVDVIEEMEFPAPTQSLLQKWLRETKDIHVEPKFDFSDVWGKKGQYVVSISSRFVVKDQYQQIYLTEDNDYPIKHFSTYEIALEKGLQEALKKK